MIGRESSRQPWSKPGRLKFCDAAVYQLKISDLPNRPGVELYPRLSVLKVSPDTSPLLSATNIPVAFDESDFEAVAGGSIITKAIYLRGGSSESPFKEVIFQNSRSSSSIADGVTKFGPLIAVVDLGNIDLEAPNQPNSIDLKAKHSVRPQETSPTDPLPYVLDDRFSLQSAKEPRTTSPTESPIRIKPSDPIHITPGRSSDVGVILETNTSDDPIILRVGDAPMGIKLVSDDYGAVRYPPRSRILNVRLAAESNMPPGSYQLRLKLSAGIHEADVPLRLIITEPMSVLDEEKSRRQRQEAKISELVTDAINIAKERVKTDPDAAVDLLKRQAASIRDNGDLSESLRSRLLDQLDAALRVIEAERDEIRRKQWEDLKKGK